MLKKHLPKQKQNSKNIPKKISEESIAKVTQGGSTDDFNPSFRFTYADENNWCLSEWNASEIDDLIRALKKIEKYTWSQIKTQGSKTKGESVGCGFKVIKQHPVLPERISEDVNISEMRVCVKKRTEGKPRSQADIIIAATARVYNLTLVTRNSKDFENCDISILNPFTNSDSY